MSLPPLVEPAAELTVDEVRRYSRHLIIPDVGMAGQKRLKNAKVLCVGAGGLGSPALMYLAAAAAKYISAGLPRPPAPTHKTFAFLRRFCPAIPTSGMIKCRL